jgi:hypothetical protein
MLYGVGYRLHLVNYFKEIMRKKEEDGYSDLLDHQYRALRYFTEEMPRGLLLFHEPGTGKTKTGAMIAAKCIELNQVDAVAFISKQSLHNNFRKTLESIGFAHQDKVHYIIQNSTKLKEALMNVAGRRYIEKISEEHINLDGVLVIIDEAHNLFSSITNGSENAVGMYELIMRSKGCRLLFMSGSPATKEAYEMAIAFNMLSGFNLLGQSYDDFQKYFISHSDFLDLDAIKVETHPPGVKNPEIFGDRITGLITHFRPDPQAKAKDFPKMFGPTIVKVNMSQTQFETYLLHRRRERQKEGAKLFGDKKPKKIIRGLSIPKGESSTYRMMSRQASNLVLPGECSVTEIVGGEKKNRYDINLFTRFDELQDFSPKTFYFLCMLRRHLPENLRGNLPETSVGQDLEGGYRVGPGVFYSNFLAYGIEFVMKTLEHFGFDRYHRSTEGDGRPKYAEVSGQVDVETQAEYLAAFNDPRNKDGSIVAILFISSSGAEGLDCRRGAHSHYFEPYWHYSRFMQVLARVSRHGGHLDLPESDRNFRSYVYLSDYPVYMEGGRSRDAEPVMMFDGRVENKGGNVPEWAEPTTDINIWVKSIARQDIIDEFYKVMKINAIDCFMSYDVPDDCRICSPIGNDNEPLIVNDLAKHINYGSKCVQVKKKKVIAYPFTFNGKEYMYYVAKEHPLDIVMTYFDPDMQEYVNINKDEPNYYKMLAAVKQLL